MIYLVTNEQFLFNDFEFKIISVEESLEILKTFDIIQYDSETDGRDCHINKLLSIQFGNKEKDIQIVVDAVTVDIKVYKEILENHWVIGQNLKFDLKFLYNYNIVPRKVYDTMIVEQLLYLGWSNKPKDPNFISCSLAAIAKRRLGIEIDKTVRGEIIYRGLDSAVIKYAANDVVHLYDILKSQKEDLKKNNCVKAAELECAFVPVIAYLEWSGIKLDEEKWKIKMQKDLDNLNLAKEALDNFVKNHPLLKDKFTYVNLQGNLFTGFDLEPKCTILWSSSTQVVEVAKALGFDTKVQNKNGEDKDSVIEKHLKKQKGVCDEFLRLYFGHGEEGDDDYYAGHQGSAKLVSSFGQGHLDAINPNTGRIHTNYWQLGADTGRMSCGSKENNTDLARLKKIGPSRCKYPNMQQLPHDEFTRACFIAEPENLWVSCDYSAIESRLGADIYNEPAMIKEYLEGSGDMHSLCAWMIFHDECIEAGCKSMADVKKLAKHWRTKVKPIEFSQQFGGSAYAIQNAMGCTLEEAQKFADAYNTSFKGIADFKREGAKNVREKGYIVLSPITGHKTYWWDHDVWLKRQESFTPEFWEDYRQNHKGTGDEIAKMVSYHFKAASKWDRKALNSVTQGLGAIILKDSQIRVFNWVINNGYFGKILLCNLTHDEANWEFPKEVKEFPNILKDLMEKAAAKYCKSLPVPAEAEVGTCWIH